MLGCPPDILRISVPEAARFHPHPTRRSPERPGFLIAGPLLFCDAMLNWDETSTPVRHSRESGNPDSSSGADPRSSARSRQCGLPASISSSFQARFHFLILFSRLIASSIVDELRQLGDHRCPKPKRYICRHRSRRRADVRRRPADRRGPGGAGSADLVRPGLMSALGGKRTLAGYGFRRRLRITGTANATATMAVRNAANENVTKRPLAITGMSRLGEYGAADTSSATPADTASASAVAANTTLSAVTRFAAPNQMTTIAQTRQPSPTGPSRISRKCGQSCMGLPYSLREDAVVSECPQWVESGHWIIRREGHFPRSRTAYLGWTYPHRPRATAVQGFPLSHRA